MPTVKEMLYSGSAYLPEEPAEEAAWYDVIARFQELSAAFDRAVAHLQAAAAEVAGNPQLEQERAALLSRAQGMLNTLQVIRASVADVRAALSGALDAISGIWGNVREWVANQLGLPPLIPIAAVVAAIATLTAFMTDYAKFAERARLYADARASGASPQEAAAIVDRVAPRDSLLSVGIGGVPLWLIGAGALAAFLFWRAREKR